MNQSFFVALIQRSLLPPQKKHIMENHIFSELYREMLLLFLKLGCSHFQLFAVSAFKTHLESCLVLFSKGWKKVLLISSICLQKGNTANFCLILNFQGWFFNKGAVTN